MVFKKRLPPLLLAKGAAQAAAEVLSCFLMCEKVTTLLLAQTCLDSNTAHTQAAMMTTELTPPTTLSWLYALRGHLMPLESGLRPVTAVDSSARLALPASTAVWLPQPPKKLPGCKVAATEL